MNSRRPYVSEELGLFVQSPIQWDEPLTAYLLRVASLNALGGTEELLRRGGAACRWNMGAPRLDRLAALLGEDAEVLKDRGYWRLGQATYRFGRHRISLGILAMQSARICPACLREDGYCRRIWDLMMCPACPVHGTLLINRCPNCSKVLRQRRKWLRKCLCGNDLAAVNPPPASSGAINVAQWLLELDRDAATSLPTRDLSTTSQLLVVLGSPIDQPLELRKKQGLGYDVVVSYAEQAHEYLADWPRGFHRWLEARYKEDPGRVSLHADFGGLLPSMRDYFRRKASKFVLDELSRWLAANWRGGLSARSRYLDPSKKRYVSVRGASRRLGLAHKTIRDLISAGDLVAVERPFGRRRKQVVDSIGFDKVASQHASFFYMPEAAERLGIATYQLLDLIRRGYIERHTKVRRGISASELVRLESALVDASCTGPAPLEATSLIALSRCRHRLSKIIALIFAGRLPLYLGAGEALFERLLCCPSDFNRESVMLIRKRICYTALEAGKLLKVSENQVIVMQKRGLLGRAPTRSHSITPEIIDEFRDRYASAAEVASRLGTLRELTRYKLRNLGISPVISTEGPRSFKSFYRNAEIAQQWPALLAFAGESQSQRTKG